MPVLVLMMMSLAIGQINREDPDEIGSPGCQQQRNDPDQHPPVLAFLFAELFGIFGGGLR